MPYNFSANDRINHTLNMVINNITELAEEQLKHIKQLTKIGESLSSETDLTKIFDMILDEGIAFTNADAATIYKVNEESRTLEFEILYNATMKSRKGGMNGPVGWPGMPLYEQDGTPRMSNIATAVYHTKQSICFDDVYETKDYDISGTKKFDSDNSYRCKSMLTIPLKNHEEEVLGVIQFINAMDNNGNIISFSDEHKTMLSSLASQAAIALSNRKLIESLENLLMQFIRSIATAIEKKSKYSSDHIMRVALLTEMLADKINRATEGAFADIHFTPTELKEISMAGWMHDFGKIITPEFVMDKSTKLERIMEGMVLVKERFAHLMTLMKYLQLSLSPAEFFAFVQQNINSDVDPKHVLDFLVSELAFISKLNVGGEFVPDADIARMEAIAAIDFNYEGHHYYILDEIDRKNLRIRYGTLNSDELTVMRAHVSVTWDMLSQLSFPKKYQNVAFYAATHHEALNGSGYPMGLNAPSLPLQSRMIAVADIFEALTAADRPYKTPKPLSESLEIIANMVKKGHLDADLVDLFIESGLFMEFATTKMRPEQIDAVDLDRIKGIYHQSALRIDN